MKLMKRRLCLALALIMILGYVPGVLQTAASQEDGLCEIHHAQHDESCGYTPAHGICGHTAHDDTCDNAARIAAIPVCACPLGEDGITIAHGETCTYEADVAAAGCSHIHGTCGYTEEIPCMYLGSCPECLNPQNEKDNLSSGSGLTVAYEADADFPNKLYLDVSFDGVPVTDTDKLSIEPVGDRNIAYISCDEELGIVVEFTVVNTAANLVYTDDSGTAHKSSLIWSAEKVFFAATFDGDDGVIHESLTMEPGEELKVKFYFDPHYKAQIQNYTALTGNLAVSDQEGLITLSEQPDQDGYYTVTAGDSVGETGIAYFGADDVKVLYITVGSQESEAAQLRLLACNPDNPNTVNTKSVAVGTEMELRCFMAPMDGGPQGDPLLNAQSSDTNVFTLSDPDENGVYVLTAVANGSANIICTVNNVEYTWSVVVQDAKYRLLPVNPEGNRNAISLNQVEAAIDLRCYLAYEFGAPIGNPLTTVTSSDTNVFTLTVKDAQKGILTLTPINPGAAQIVYTTGEKTYTCDVVVLDRNFKADGLLYYPAVHSFSKKTFPVTVVNLAVGDGIAKKFYYSEQAEAALLAEDSSSLIPLTIDDVTWSGPITVVQPDGDDKLHIIGNAVGTGYLEVTSEDGITHCFVVNIGRSRPDTEIVDGGYMWLDDDIVIGFGNPGIKSDGDNNAEPGVLKMRSQINSGFGANYPEDYRYREPVAFAAMNKTHGIVAAEVMNSVRNVQFSILACRNTDGSSGSYASIEKAACEKVDLSEGNISAWTNYVVAGGTDGFKGVAGMTFDLPDKKTITKGDGTTEQKDIIRRISLYMLMHNTFMGNEVVVEANITSAAQLNVILSSYEALKTWIKAEYPEYEDVVDNVCNVDIKLPAGDFTDTVVVSETIAPFPYRDNPPSNPNFRIYLRGPIKDGKTKMAGLISRGSLAGVLNVDFLATEGITMTRGEETFTCGMMADSEWTGSVVYDMEFAERYGIDPTKNKRNISSWPDYSGLKYLDCDILAVHDCSFEGFDYGTRSTVNGYVGGGEGNSFKKCYFGIYIDCEGKPGWGEISYTGFSGYDFKKNVAAVRIVGLQDNVTPYEFRIHDCDFINNYLEFWISKYDTTYLQNYYFYRNHYSGGWNKPTGNWYKYGSSSLGNETLPEVDHRGPKYSEEMLNGVDIYVSGTPSRSIANLSVNRSAGSDGYWIYSGDDQVTRIEQDGDDLPIAQEALENLTGDADVSIVTNQGKDTVAVWTFEGGE